MRTAARAIDRIRHRLHLGGEPPVAVYANLNRVVGGVWVLRDELFELRSRFVDGEFTEARGGRPSVQFADRTWGHCGAPFTSRAPDNHATKVKVARMANIK